MKNVLKILIIILLLLLIPMIALADTLYLKDGSIIEGKIINVTNNNVTIENDLGTLIINKENIEKIEFSEIEEEQTEEDKLREKIKEKLKGLFDEEDDIIIIIISADELSEESDDTEEENNNENNVVEEENNNENNVVEEENNNENNVVEEENNNENENNVEVHNEYEENNAEEENNNENENNVEVHNEYEENNAEEENNNENENNAEEWENTEFNWVDEKDYPTKNDSIFSFGIISLTTMDMDLWYMEESSSMFGISFRYTKQKSCFGVNLDANIGFDMELDGVAMYALGISLRLPKKVSPYLTIGGTYKHNLDNFIMSNVGAYIGNGVEFFFSDAISMQIYTNVHFTILENMSDYYDDFYTNPCIPELFMGVVLYFNF